jgi:hypothetical protein
LNSAAEGDWIEAMRGNDFRRAWEISDYDLRQCGGSRARKYTGERHLQQIWRGEDLRGKRVLVRCYHGLGDTIQFVRFASPLHQIAREVILWAQPELLGLLRGVRGVDRLLPLDNGTPNISYDVDIEIMELAHALRVTAESISKSVPYLPRPQCTRPRCDHSLSIGLVWEAGNWDRKRGVPPEMFSRLLAQPDVRLFSLQQGPASKAATTIPAQDIGTPDLVSFARTITSLDLVITVDTMAAHLAGALGAPVWTLLHANCDWRWPTTDSRSIWYPSMKLFHQKRPGDWSNVIEKVAEELKHLRQARLPDGTERTE